MLSQPLTAASPMAWILAIAAAIAYALPALATQHLQEKGARHCLRLAWALHALFLGWGLLGEFPRFGFAPALSITAWLVLTVYVVEQQLYPQLSSRWPLSIMGSLAVLLAVVFPGSPLHVDASPWLPLHLALGIASYGLFAAAVVHAALMSHAERQMRQGADHDGGLPLLTLERLTFRFVGAGFILLTATLAAVFAGSIAAPARAGPGDSSPSPRAHAASSATQTTSALRPLEFGIPTSPDP